MTIDAQKPVAPEDVLDMIEQLRDWPDMCQQYSDRAADMLETLSRQLAETERSYAAAMDCWLAWATKCADVERQLAEAQDQRGTLLCEGSTLNPKWTPLGNIIRGLEQQLAESRAREELLAKALARIEWEVDGREDINNDGGPNLMMRIGNECRAALGGDK